MALNSQIKVSADQRSRKNITTINGINLKHLFRASLSWLKCHQAVINALNVFPVPDGDTGTNMLLTMQSAYQEIADSNEENIGKVMQQIAQGALMGARGNSGVILSQLIRGFSRTLDNIEVMDADLMNQAFAESRNTAYKGVVRPVEGTILTVSKDIASASEDLTENNKNLIDILEGVITAAEQSVKNTPNLLPILKQAGVVDSGGKGLLIILEGMYRYATNQPVDIGEVAPENEILSLDQISNNEIHDSIEPGQDFEVVVDFKPKNNFDLKKFYDRLADIGTSIQVGEGDDIYRMHIHVETDRKYEPIEMVGNFGVVKKVYIENLLEQMGQTEKKKNFSNEVKADQIAVITISPGDGISEIFQSLGAARVIGGGQTMNPSTNDIYEAFKDLPTDKIIILPNNKNIIMAAEEAKKLTNKNVVVIPSISIPQGMVSCLRLDPNGDFDDIVEGMREALTEVETGEITTATRSIKINEVNVKKGEVISLLNGKLVYSSQSIFKSCSKLLEIAKAEDREHITIFYGDNVERKIVDKFVQQIESEYPNHEIEVHFGGQPHYQFILSVE
ncbi:MAG: DAK2 domain-containing protein [Anaerolineaceae bacterium]|nr:DAK2 domain-containing protein [Anaerolineaceae bacterium]